MVRLHRIDYMPLENIWFTLSKPLNYLYCILHACDGQKCESSAVYCMHRQDSQNYELFLPRLSVCAIFMLYLRLKTFVASLLIHKYLLMSARYGLMGKSTREINEENL